MIMSKKPLERIQVDLVKIPMYMKLDFKYLMTFKDHYSRMADVFMLINKTSSATSKALKEYIGKIGIPEKIQCDNGTEFKGEFLSTVATFGVKLINGRPYHPQSQGSVESFNRYLKKKILEMFLEKKEDFNLQNAIKLFLEEYNCRKTHSSTQQIPTVLFHCKSEIVHKTVQESLKKFEKYQKSKI